MSFEMSETLPEEQRLAIAYTPVSARPSLASFFALDRRLAQIVSKTTEPMLGQMRLAWWRDMLAKPVSERPGGDAVLDALGEHWAGREASLIANVDAWELLVAEEQLLTEHIVRYGEMRGVPFAALAGKPLDRAGQDRVEAAGLHWALADAASHIAEQTEREAFVLAALGRVAVGGPFPRELRGLAVLQALSLRALKAGGRPLMEGRGAALTALRVALLGR